MRLRADTFTAGLALAFAAFIIQQGLELGLGRASNPGSGFILFWTGLIMAGLAATVLVQRSFGHRWSSLLPSIALLHILHVNPAAVKSADLICEKTLMGRLR